MNQPLVVNLPHKLGREEARRRIAGSTDKLVGYIPGPAADIQSRWIGDRLNLVITTLGQQVASQIDVEDSHVRLEVLLPGLLGAFAGQIGGFLEQKGTELLEDKSKK
jgi:hypothetical protein